MSNCDNHPDKPALYRVTVFYDDEHINTATMLLCKECMEKVKADCIRDDYEFEWKKITYNRVTPVRGEDQTTGEP